MDRNLELYPWYQALRHGIFWLPVFFLYFLSVVSLEEALLLESIYYVSVVVLEIPSGYFSDRVGRRVTLILSNAALVGGAALFAGSASFGAFAAAQVLMAVSNAFNSGTDTALLYDSLCDVEREEEIGDREAHAISVALAAAAGASAVGGLSAGIDLRLAYVLTGLAGVGALAVAFAFREPAAHRRATPVAKPTRQVLAHLRDPALRWTSAFVVSMIVLNHVPYTFFQPYLDLLFADRNLGDYETTPAVTGLLAGAMMLLGSRASRRSMDVRRRLGSGRALLVTMALQIGIISIMAAVLSPWVMLAILFRSVPIGLVTPISNAEIHPRVSTQLRATYLSVQSLTGRLVFSIGLALASRTVAGDTSTHPVLAELLAYFAAGGALAFAALAVTLPRFAPRTDPS